MISDIYKNRKYIKHMYMYSKNIASFHVREIEAIWILSTISHSVIFFHKQTLYLRR